MPSVSKSQQRLAGADLARARAGKKTRTGMSESQLEDFAATKTKGLPTRVKPPKMKTAAGRKAMGKAMRRQGP
jgi:hypothetical protein